MRRRTLAAAGLVWLVPLFAQADYYNLVDDVQERSLAAGADLSVGAVQERFGLAILETEVFDTAVSPLTFYDELPGMGEYGRGVDPLPPVPVVLDSAFTTHLLHFGLPSMVDGPYTFSATVVFDAEIVAIIWTDEGLERTDTPPIGAGYAQTPQDFRMLELRDREGDLIRRRSDGVSIKLDLTVSPEDPIDQVRVITRAESPQAMVYIECDSRVVTVGPAAVTFEGTVRNAGPDLSLPIGLRVAWNPPRADAPGDASLSFDGTAITCDGRTPATCGLSRIALGPHDLRAVIDGLPGETIGVDVSLVGAGTTRETCHLQGTIPGGSPGADAGVPPPPGDVIPVFSGGGGCVCEVGAPAATPWALLAFLGCLLAWRRRR